MSWKAKNKQYGYEVPLDESGPLSIFRDTTQPWFAARAQGDSQVWKFFLAEFDLIEEYELPTKHGAVIKVTGLPRPRVLLYDKWHERWREPGGTVWSTPELETLIFRALPEPLKMEVLFEGVDE
jgi:hypothetical protein